ncbi:MAG: hypothetical protein ACYCO3_00455 [Mycobacteriales bacterium]
MRVRSSGRRRPAALTVSVALLGLLAVGLAVASGVLASRLASLRGQAAAREQALQAARQTVTNLVSFDYRHLSAQFRVLAADTTGVFHGQLAKYESQVRSAFDARHLVAHGLIDDAAVASANSKTASILVAVDDTIAPLGSAVSKAVPQRYRMIVTMSRTHGRWLLSNIQVAP